MDIRNAWLMLGPLSLFALYGYTEYRAMSAFGYPRKRLAATSLWLFLTLSVVCVIWTVWTVPLPALYVLAYLLRSVRYLSSPSDRTKNLFLLNLGYVNALVLHLVLVGSVALARGVAMRDLLASPFWRVASLAATVALEIGEDLLLLHRKGLAEGLKATSESEEVRLFMNFLWFCTGYLLIDSLLCEADLEPFYTTLFLIGSSAILMFILTLFLWHIHSIRQRNHLKDEYERLSAELADRARSASALRLLADRDALTGVYSRRYAMERLEEMIRAGEAFALAFLDLDGLKQVNDQEGHDAGDRYLIQFAQTLGGWLREGDILARVGGDEFVVLMPGCGETAARKRMDTIRNDITESGIWRGRVFSFGVTSHTPGDPRSAGDVLQAADRVMYQDKKQK